MSHQMRNHPLLKCLQELHRYVYLRRVLQCNQLVDCPQEYLLSIWASLHSRGIEILNNTHISLHEKLPVDTLCQSKGNTPIRMNRISFWDNKICVSNIFLSLSTSRTNLSFQSQLGSSVWCSNEILAVKYKSVIYLVGKKFGR